MKAKFRVVIIHDPAMRALSNMPVQNFEVEGGWRHEIFEETPKMSTYLLAFVVCDFDFTTSPKTNDNVEVSGKWSWVRKIEYAALPTTLFTKAVF